MYYKLTTDEGNKKKFSRAISLNAWPIKKITCDICKREWDKSLIYESGTYTPIVLSNNFYPNFAWYYVILISEETLQVLSNEGITGYIPERIDIFSVNDLTPEHKSTLKKNGISLLKIPSEPPNYYKMFVSVGAAFHEKSNIILKEKCEKCGYVEYVTKGKEWVDNDPVVLKNESLAGNDLFLSEGYGAGAFCSERFVEVYNKHNLTGLLFNEIEVI